MEHSHWKIVLELLGIVVSGLELLGNCSEGSLEHLCLAGAEFMAEKKYRWSAEMPRGWLGQIHQIVHRKH